MLGFGYAVAFEEGARRIRPVDLKPVMPGPVTLHETDVVVWETSGYNFNALPPNLRKSIVNDLGGR